tara:strand:- start:258 stop:467 length:210 start_codon:yes stop_codon:yes gene_type:complete
MSGQAQVVTIDGKEYKQEDLTQQQIVLINHASKWQTEANKIKESFDNANRLHQSYLFDLKASLANSDKK